MAEQEVKSLSLKADYPLFGDTSDVVWAMLTKEKSKKMRVLSCVYTTKQHEGFI